MFIDRKDKVEEEDGKLSVAHGIQERGAASRPYSRQENNRNLLHAQMLLATRESCKRILGCKCAIPNHQNEGHKVVQTVKRMTLKRPNNAVGTNRGKT
jgi:hypothetical protein